MTEYAYVQYVTPAPADASDLFGYIKDVSSHDSFVVYWANHQETTVSREDVWLVCVRANLCSKNLLANQYQSQMYALKTHHKDKINHYYIMDNLHAMRLKFEHSTRFFSIILYLVFRLFQFLVTGVLIPRILTSQALYTIGCTPYETSHCSRD